MPDTTTSLRTKPHPACPLCSQEGRIAYADVRDRAHNVPGTWSFRECRRCEVAWLDPQPVDEDVGLCYPGIYYTHATSQAGGASPFGTPGPAGRVRDAILAGRYGYAVPGVSAGMARLGRLLGRVGPVRERVAHTKADLIPHWRPDGTLLDIGCGGGQHLDFARALGWRTFGLEPDPVAADVARASGAVVEVATLETAKIPDAPFDAVTSMHSIEHARDPRRFLHLAYAALKPGGFFYLQTPNWGSLMRRRFGADWYALEVSRHLSLLTVPAMQRLLLEQGPWRSLSVRSNPRRAVREQEQTLAMRRTGSFEAMPTFSRRDRMGMAGWALVERAGNHLAHWGEEIEVIGVKG